MLLAATVIEWSDAVGALTAPAVLALIIVLLLRGDMVTRRSHESIIERCSEELAKVERDRDRWRDVALDSLIVTEAAVGRKPR